jgi:hypothetical protein
MFLTFLVSSFFCLNKSALYLQKTVPVFDADNPGRIVDFIRQEGSCVFIYGLNDGKQKTNKKAAP